jgi:hypothetical protein
MECKFTHYFYKCDDDPPDWCHPEFSKPLPMSFTKKRAEVLKRDGKLKDYIWSTPKMPGWSKKKGPINFLYTL